MIEVTIQTVENVNVHISEWDEGGVWIRLGSRRSSMHTPMTRNEAEQLLECLQAILAQEVTA